MKRTLLAIGALLAVMLPAPAAQAAPAIRFLNPSGYSGQVQAYEISPKNDQDGAIHIVAWVKEVPASPLVEFEIESTTQKATLDGVRAGTDAWETFWVPPASFTDGPYTLRAILYNGTPGSASEVTSTEVPVVLNADPVPPPPAQETVEMGHPDNGGEIGFFTPKGKQPATLIDFTASELTRQVRVLYTMSDPGNDPVWVACGFAGVPESFAGRARCTLKAGDNPLDVTAIAAVANMTAPQAEGNPALDETGDAHRVKPYISQATTVEITPETAQVDDLTKCGAPLALRVFDQRNRPIPAANVDIHATGPSDQLAFGAMSNNRTSAFQAPDAAHPSSEDAIDCADGTRSGKQGDHNVPLDDDVKHIESTTGTDNNGEFRFALRSDSTGGTALLAWADVNDDDLPGTSEITGGARIGWGGPPPPPTTELTLSPSERSAATGSCVQFDVLARRGGSPLASTNVDVHLSGPDANASFCDVSGGSTRRDPDSGGHSLGGHEDGTRHAEGETSSTGTFTFGVTSPTQGQTNVTVWLDTTDDDVSNGEMQRTATVTWTPPGERSISIQSNRSRVRKGRNVTLSGAIQGSSACASTQSVRIESKPLRGGSFQTVETVTTDTNGDYSTRVRMSKARRFRAAVDAADPCQPATSNTVTVRIRR